MVFEVTADVTGVFFWAVSSLKMQLMPGALGAFFFTELGVVDVHFSKFLPIRLKGHRDVWVLLLETLVHDGHGELGADVPAVGGNFSPVDRFQRN